MLLRVKEKQADGRLMIGQIGSPETSVNNYQSTPRNSHSPRDREAVPKRRELTTNERCVNLGLSGTERVSRNVGN